MLHRTARTADHDEALSASVVLALAGRISRPVEDLRIHSRGGGLVLKGRVRSHYIKQMVEQVVMDASDGSILANELEVVGRRRPRPAMGAEIKEQ